MKGSARMEGYRECHICAVKEKMEARRCVYCTGQLDLKDLLLLREEKRWRKKVAPFLSAIVPGLGHWYTGRRYIGTYFFAMAPLSVGLVLSTYQKWNWGLTVLTISFVLVWLLAILDSMKGSYHFTPPCQAACPGEISCSHYVHLAAKGMDLESLELVEAACPFPGTIGRICHHPCEEDCNRGKDGEPVAICALKRFVDDQVDRPYDFYRRELEKNKESLGKMVAVVGAGPSGLSAALYLRLFGFDVSLFEARDFAGGTPAIYLPTFRLPVGIYRREVDRILNLGLDLRFGRRLGEDFTLEDVQDEGFSAVYLATGAMRSIRLPHTGEEAEGFLDGREFLERINLEGPVNLDGEVLVVGGGNVAMNVARSAVRSGADKVRVVCLEKRPKARGKRFEFKGSVWQEIKPTDWGEFMPAHPWEIADALKEGVEIIDESATVNFEKKDNRVAQASCVRVERIDQDQYGRLVPVLKEGTEFNVRADWVLTAVGSAPDFSFLGTFHDRTSISGRIPLIRLEGETGVTMPVIAGGDMALGPCSVIEGIAAGKEAALHLYRKLVGSAPVSIRYRSRRIMEPWANYADSLDFRTRRREFAMPEEERKTSFNEIYGGFAVKAAREEAERCMRCDWPLVRESKVRKFFRTKNNSSGKISRLYTPDSRL